MGKIIPGGYIVYAWWKVQTRLKDPFVSAPEQIRLCWSDRTVTTMIAHRSSSDTYISFTNGIDQYKH